MTNSRARGGAVLLETYTAAGAESTVTFLATGIPFTTYKKFILEITLDVTSTFVLYAKWNGNVAAYDTRSVQLITSTLAAFTSIAGSACAIASSSVCSTNQKINATVTFQINTGTITARTDVYVCGSQTQEHGVMEHSDSSETDLNNLIITPSTSTWKTGTIMKLYGVPA